MRKFWNSKGTNRRGILAVCLAFTLMLSLLPQAFGSAEKAAETDPYLTITAVGVENTYVELGLNIQAQTKGFRSVGAVVTYDPALLTPVDWAEEPTSVTLTEQPADADTYTEEEARTEWNTVATTLETKGPDELSGKTALTFVKGGTAPVGYLYLSAEAPQLIEGATEIDGVLTGGWNQPLPETAPLTEGEEATAVTTASGIPVVIPTASPLETPVEQSVVVRFKLIGGDMAAALASIDLVTGDVAVGSPVHDDSGVAYFHNNKGDSLPVNTQILRAEVGTTYFTGGGGGGAASTDGIIPITFFDWDGTLLSTEIVGAAGDLETQTEAVQAVLDAYELSILPEGYTKGDDGLYSAIVEDTSEGAAEGATKIEWNRDGYTLSEKWGYSFGCWVPYDSETPTVYGNYVNPIRVSDMTETPLPKPSDEMNAAAIAQQILDGATSIILKAAYVDNANCEMTDMESRRYTVTIDDISRFVATGANFPVTVKVERGDVPRCVEPALRVKMTVGKVTTYSLFELAGADEEYVTVSLYADINGNAVETAVFEVFDMYATANWVGAGARNDTDTVTLVGGTIENLPLGLTGDRTTACFSADSFARLGIVGMINECLEDYALSGAISDMSRITVASVRQAGIYAKAVNNTTKTNLFNAWKAQNTDPDGNLVPGDQYTDLTWQQIYDTINPPESGT